MGHIYLLYRHWWNTRIFPVTKIWCPVKIQFLSFTCEDITVVMATSVSANRKRASHIGVYIINRILHARLWIRILTCHVQLVSKRMHVISSIYEIKWRFVYLKSQKYWNSVCPFINKLWLQDLLMLCRLWLALLFLECSVWQFNTHLKILLSWSTSDFPSNNGFLL